MPKTTGRKIRFIFQSADPNCGWINLYMNGYYSASLLVWHPDEKERENNASHAHGKIRRTGVFIFHHLSFIYTSNGHVVSLFQQNHVL
jgi:hypothetical protein